MERIWKSGKNLRSWTLFILVTLPCLASPAPTASFSGSQQGPKDPQNRASLELNSVYSSPQVHGPRLRPLPPPSYGYYNWQYPNTEEESRVVPSREPEVSKVSVPSSSMEEVVVEELELPPELPPFSPELGGRKGPPLSLIDQLSSVLW